MKISQTSSMSMKSIKNISLFLLLNTSTLLNAQEKESIIETDRPDMTEASSTVPKGFLQIETGAFYETFKQNQVKTQSFTYNTTLLRYGIFNTFELRLGWDIQEITTTVNGKKLNPNLSGLNPMLLGMKAYITEEKGWIPEISLIGHIHLPFTASKDFKPETTSVDFRFSCSHSLSKSSSLGYNFGIAWEDDATEASYIYTLAYGHSISEKFGFFAEIYGDLPEDNKANHLWDAGITYLVSNDFQLDMSFGTSITEGQDFFISAGASFRLPIINN